MSKGFASNYRIVLLASGILLSFTGMGVRLVCLHVVDRDELMKFVTKARRQVIPEHARRGDILDVNGRLLASSHTQVVLGVDPQSLRKEDEAKWPELAQLLDLPLADLQKIFATKHRKIEAPAAVTVTAAGGIDFLSALNAAKTGSPAAPAAAAAAPADTTRSPGDLHLTLDAQAAVEDPAADATDENDGEIALEDDPEANGYKLIRWAKLSDHVDEGTYDKIEALGIKGIYGTRAYRRAYPHNELAAHIVGYVNRNGAPMAGVESYADFYLRGENGWREGERDGRGREVAQFRTREVTPSNGYSVTLSLDTVVQHFVEEEIDAIVKKFSPSQVTIIVSNPRDGFILAMANYPSFDLNEFSKVPKADQASMKNIAVTDILEPGSTFKIVAVSGALEDKIITPSDRFDCTLEKAEYKGKMLGLPRESELDHFDHPLNISEIIAHSSNKGAAQIGMKLGEQRLYDYARAFGFGGRLGFPMGGEVPGMLARPEKWSGTDITRIPMGHTIAATPLQMHQAMCTIATGGVLLRPQIIKQISDASGEVVYRYERAEIDRAVSERTARIMATMLMGVASKNGTAPEAAIPGFDVAGKTGTTQMIVDGKYSEHHHIASFVGFFPATDPQWAITVIVHDADARAPGGIAYGKSVAAPSFKRIGEQLIQYKGIQPPGAPVPAGRSLLAMEGARR
jgi:cell division protein FtsI (penicillin-binding protein 3)